MLKLYIIYSVIIAKLLTDNNINYIFYLYLKKENLS